MSNVKGHRSNVLSKYTYLDYASTTPIDPDVLKVMQNAEKEVWGNPSSLHKEGVLAKKLLDESRTMIARSLECKKEDLIFTSGGTESNNLAILGVVHEPKEAHIITTNIEHSSVLEPIRELEKRGAKVTYIRVKENGIVDLNDIKKAILPNTVLVSIQYANSEIGTVQPIRKISKLILQVKSKKLKVKSRHEKMYPFFHTDASQAPLYLNCTQSYLGADLMTLDSHKICGPKGVGLLYVRKNTPIVPIIFGGGQEKGIRSTTENVPAISGFAKAMEIATSKKENESKRLLELCNYFHSNILKNIGMSERVIVNGSVKEGERLPNNINISVKGIDAEFLVLQLDARGISCSTKSSCEEGMEESYVVRALGKEKWRAKNTLRFSLGRQTKKGDIDRLIKTLSEILEK